MKFSLTAERAAVGAAVSATVLDVRPGTALVVRLGESHVRRLAVTRAGKIRAVFAYFAAPGESVAIDAAIEPASPDAWIDGIELLGIEERPDEKPPVAEADLLVRQRTERPNETVLEIIVRPESDRRYSKAIVRIGVRPTSPLAFVPSTVAAFVGDRAPVIVELIAPFPDRAIDVALEVGRMVAVRVVGTQPLDVGDVRCIALNLAKSR